MRLVVLVDQPGADAFAEFGMAAAVEAHGEFHLQGFGQGHVASAVQLFPDQMGGQRATGHHCFCCSGEQGVVAVLQVADGVPGAGQVADVQ